MLLPWDTDKLQSPAQPADHVYDSLRCYFCSCLTAGQRFVVGSCGLWDLGSLRIHIVFCRLEQGTQTTRPDSQRDQLCQENRSWHPCDTGLQDSRTSGR